MQYKFPCGCTFPVIKENTDPDVLPLLDFNIDNINLNCSAVWELLGRGLTKGVFQLESQLGRSWTKKLKPQHIEHLAALGALLRPGCISRDTKIAVGFNDRKNPTSQRNTELKWITMGELHEKFKRNHVNYSANIISLDNNNNLFSNKIVDIFYSGKKDVYSLQFMFHKKAIKASRRYNLECTLDHPLLTHNRGWVELQNLIPGERVAVLRRTGNKSKHRTNAEGEKAFRTICYREYEYKCVFCNWKEGSLDVNHLNGNRQSNNKPNNLCFMCPNHHRMFTEEKISKEEVIEARVPYKLKNTKDILWAEYTGKVLIGEKDTYDIEVEGPHHNFVAGNVVVHNCLRAIDEKYGCSMTELYCLRKNGEADVEYPHDSIKKILEPTFGVLTYQEQAMEIVKVLALFTLEQADELRKAIGKKLAEEMAKVKVKYFEGAAKAQIVSDNQAKEIFGWIEKSQRYSFNKSHAVSYGINGYISAFCKAHFPVQFYTSWLFYAKDKGDPQQEIKELVNDAKLLDIPILPPDILKLEAHFSTDGKAVTFGLSNIKGIGEGQVEKLKSAIDSVEELLSKNIKDWSWYELLVHLTPYLSTNVVSRLITVGALRNFGNNRTKMLAEYNSWCELTQKEQEWIRNRSINKQNIDRLANSMFGKIENEPQEENQQTFTNLIEAMKCLSPAKKDGGGCANIKRSAAVKSIANLLEKPPTLLQDTPQWIAWNEENLLSIPLTCTVIDSCDTSASNCSCKEYLAGRDGFMVFAVKVESVRIITTKNGKSAGSKMAFLTVSDSTCAVEMIVFPDAWLQYSSLLNEGNTLTIQAKRDKKKDSLILEKCYQI